MKLNVKTGFMAVLVGLLPVLGPVAQADMDIISTNATWKYEDSGNYPGGAWASLEFDDSGWLSGVQPIGYGEWQDGGPVTNFVATTIASTTITTLYARSTFVLTGVSTMMAVQVTALIDDNAIVWLNGQRVWSVGMTNDIGSITNTTLSSGSVEGQTLMLKLSPTLFNEGSNVLAVEVHNESPSSDMFMQTSLLQVDPAYAATTNIALGSNWKVNDFGNPGADWTNSAFDASSWRTLPGAIGFNAGLSNVASLVYAGPTNGDRKATYFLRKTFTVADVAAVGTVTCNALIDDGAVIYLNGELVGQFRANVGSDYTNYATANSVGNGLTPESVAIPNSVLMNGVNTLAVELKQGTAGSSDLRFDAELSYSVIPGGALSLEISTTNTTVSNATTTYDVNGTSSNVVGDLWWTNSLGGSGTSAAGAAWEVSSIPLTEGTNVIMVTGTNAAGSSVSDSVTIIRTILTYSLDVTTASAVVSNSVTSITVDGNEMNLAGDLSWDNSAGGSGTIAAVDPWTISGVSLAVGVNTITVSGTNSSGGTYQDSVTITRSSTDYTAYNDTAWHQDASLFGGAGVELAAVGYATNSPWGKVTGNFKTASDVEVIAKVTFSGTANMLARDFAFESGSDAEFYFSGHTGVDNAMQWGSGTVNMNISGLNPAKVYEIVIWSTRGGRTTSYSNRFTEISISGADAFNNGSSTGVEIFGAGNLGSRVRASEIGYVARYTVVNPGTDGQVDFAMTAGADQLHPAGSSDTNGYINAVMIKESEPAGGGDGDLDGMDDAWETLYFGSTSAPGGGTLEDFDGDGSINYDEYIAGTDPDSATSKLQFTGGLTNAPGTLVFSWAGVNGKTYSIQGASTLTSAWSVIQSGIAGVSPTTVYTGSTATARNYMRVKVE